MLQIICTVMGQGLLRAGYLSGLALASLDGATTRQAQLTCLRRGRAGDKVCAAVAAATYRA